MARRASAASRPRRRALAEAVNAAKNVTVDVGQVMFGQTVTISSDVLRQFNARDQARPRKWVIFDGDANGGGIVPYNYRANDFYNALQWAIGLELFLLIDDPWRVFFTTDHPNGAPFTTYPEIFALLMSRDLRAEWIARLPPAAMAMTTLPSIKREYTLAEIAIMTRAAPGPAARPRRPRPSRRRRRRRRRGLRRRARPGADVPLGRAGVQGRRLVVRDGKVTHYRFGRALTVRPEHDARDRRGA